MRHSTKIASGLNGGPDLSDFEEFGTALASIGDLDGDGLAELAVGAAGSWSAVRQLVNFINAECPRVATDKESVVK